MNELQVLELLERVLKGNVFHVHTAADGHESYAIDYVALMKHLNQLIEAKSKRLPPIIFDPRVTSNPEDFTTTY